MKVYVEQSPAHKIGVYKASYFLNPKFGDVTGGNYTEIESDGTLVSKGRATVYNDIIIYASNLRPGGTPPIFAAFQNGVYGARFDNAVVDEVHGAIEIPHDYMEGTTLEVHVHWSPTTTNTGSCTWGFEYTVAQMQTGTFGTTTTISSGTSGSGVVNKHQYTSMGTIAGTGMKIGAVIAFRCFRDGSADAFSGNAFLHSIGIHYQSDTLGSRAIATK